MIAISRKNKKSCIERVYRRPKNCTEFNKIYVIKGVLEAQTLYVVILILKINAYLSITAYQSAYWSYWCYHKY